MKKAMKRGRMFRKDNSPLQMVFRAAGNCPASLWKMKLDDKNVDIIRYFNAENVDEREKWIYCRQKCR